MLGFEWRLILTVSFFCVAGVDPISNYTGRGIAVSDTEFMSVTQNTDQSEDEDLFSTLLFSQRVSESVPR